MNTPPPKFTTVEYPPPTPRIPAQPAVLEERLLHKIFMLSHLPVNWGAGKITIGLLLLAFVVELLWLPFGPITYLVAGIYLLFAVSDWLLLAWLPRAGRSFGPIGPQLLVMTLPRVGAAGLAAGLAWLLGMTSGLAVGLMILLQLAGSATYLWGMLHEPFALQRTEREVTLPQWSAAQPPLRLLHLSDLHVERLTRREHSLLALIKQTAPDLIVITGDFLNLSYVDEPLARNEVRKILLELEAPFGVYATLGSPPVDPRSTTPSLLAGTNIRLLRDEALLLNLPDGRQLSLLGLDCEHDLASDVSAFQSLIATTPVDVPRVLLYHSPELMPQVQQEAVALYLCGHTHGGQVRLPFYGAILTSSALGKRYEMGPYLEQETLLYISRGVGLEGMSAPRLRLLCQPEITLFTLSGR